MISLVCDHGGRQDLNCIHTIVDRQGHTNGDVSSLSVPTARLVQTTSSGFLQRKPSSSQGEEEFSVDFIWLWTGRIVCNRDRRGYTTTVSIEGKSFSDRLISHICHQIWKKLISLKKLVKNHKLIVAYFFYKIIDSCCDINKKRNLERFVWFLIRLEFKFYYSGAKIVFLLA